MLQPEFPTPLPKATPELRRRDGAIVERSQGAEVLASGGVRFRTWCEHDRAEVVIFDEQGKESRSLELQPEEDGYFSAVDEDGKPGDLYKYRVGESGPWPDPASRFQPNGVHGASMVVDPERYIWSDEQW